MLSGCRYNCNRSGSSVGFGGTCYRFKGSSYLLATICFPWKRWWEILIHASESSGHQELWLCVSGRPGLIAGLQGGDMNPILDKDWYGWASSWPRLLLSQTFTCMNTLAILFQLFLFARPMKMEQCQRIKFRFTRKKEYSQNTAKVWNQDHDLFWVIVLFFILAVGTNERLWGTPKGDSLYKYV